MSLASTATLVLLAISSIALLAVWTKPAASVKGSLYTILLCLALVAADHLTASTHPGLAQAFGLLSLLIAFRLFQDLWRQLTAN